MVVGVGPKVELVSSQEEEPRMWSVLWAVQQECGRQQTREKALAKNPALLPTSPTPIQIRKC